MRNYLCFIWNDVVIISAICLIACLLAPTAKAGSLSSNGSNDDSYWGQFTSSSNTDWGTRYNLTSWYQTKGNAVENASITASQNNNVVRLSTNAQGRLGTNPSDTLSADQNLFSEFNVDSKEEGKYFSGYIRTGWRTQPYDDGGKGEAPIGLEDSNTLIEAAPTFETWAYATTEWYVTAKGIDHVSPSMGFSYGRSYDGGTLLDLYPNFNASWDFVFSTQSLADTFSAELADNGVTVQAVDAPEPSSLAFLGLGAIGLIGRRRRK